jgi:hypothetical protein
LTVACYDGATGAEGPEEPETPGGLIDAMGLASNSDRKSKSDEGGDEISEKGKDDSSKIT